MDALREILFLDPTPRLMRNPSFVGDQILRGDGSNLSSVLSAVCANETGKKAVLEFVQELPEQEITDLQFLPSLRNEVLLQLEETFGDEKKWREATLLSDGTLRVLAMAAALHSAPESGTVVLEEIDNGIHPSRISTLLQSIQKVAKARNLAILITSHNPALLDALPLDAIPDTVFCYREPLAGDSRLVRLQDFSNYPELVARGPLGRLVTQRIMERMIKSGQTPEQREAASLK